MNDKGFNPLTASRDATSNVPRGVPPSSEDEWVALGKTLSRDFQNWLRNQSVGWLADQDLRQEILGQISLLEAEIQPLLAINREFVELEQLLTTGFSTTNFEEGSDQSASASENQPSSGATALSSEELASHQDGINPISEPKLKKEAESSPPSFHPQPESQLQVGGLKNLAQRLEFEQQQEKSSAKTQAEIASPTQLLPEIPNSPSSQQLGETTNIALPLSREGIINEYQSTPNRELSPPIDREEENPPPKNYSPTSKVNPTYASSSLLLANSLPVETVSPQEKEKKSDEPINDSPTGNSINKSKSSDLSTTQEDNFSDRQWTVSNLDQENRRERKNPLTRVSQQNSRIFSLKNTAKFSHKYARSKSPSPNFDTTEQPQVLKKIEEKSQAISESIPQQSHLCEAEIDLIVEAIAEEIQQQYRQFYGS